MAPWHRNTVTPPSSKNVSPCFCIVVIPHHRLPHYRMENPALSLLSLTDLLTFDPRHAQRDGERDCCCPLCGGEKRVDAAHRSLSYNARTGLFRCARCGAKGLLREWHQSGEEKNAPWQRSRRGGGDASRSALRRKMSLPAAPPDPTPPAKSTPGWQEQLRAVTPLAKTPGETYVQRERGLPSLLCHRGGVRFARNFYGRAAVLFPLRDGDGGLVAAQGRYLDPNAAPRMRTAGERKKGVFLSVPELWAEGRTPDTILVTEAPLDALTLAFAGLPWAVALCGCEGLPEWLRRRAAFKTVYAAFDADEAGDRASLLLADLLRPLGATVVRLRPDGAKDWNALLQERGWDALHRGLSAVFPAPLCWSRDFLDELCESAFLSEGESVEAVEARFERDGLLHGEPLARQTIARRQEDT